MHRRHLLLFGLPALSAQRLFADLANGDRGLERLFARFMAPCCWRESLLVHHSPKADELRGEIRDLIAAGRTDDEINSIYVNRYSSRILSVPEGAPGRWLSWMPWLISAAGIAAVATVIRKSLHKTRHAVPSGATPLLDDQDWD